MLQDAQRSSAKRKISARVRPVESSPEQPSLKLAPLAAADRTKTGSKRGTRKGSTNDHASRAYFASNSENAGSLSDRELSDSSTSTVSGGHGEHLGDLDGLLQIPRRFFSASPNSRRSSATETSISDGQLGQRTASILVEKPPANSLGHILSHNHLFPYASSQNGRPSSPTPALAARKRTSSPAPSSNSIRDRGSPINGSPEPPAKKGSYTIRLDLLPEVALLTSAMVLVCYRIASLHFSDIFPPAAPLILITILTPWIALIRRPAGSLQLMVPFTDERGYRDRMQADDGFACGVCLPILLAAGFAWEAQIAHRKGHYLRYTGVRDLTEMWNVRLEGPPPAVTIAELTQNLIDSRTALLVLTALNSFVLIVHLVLARTFLAINWLPVSNTRRLFASFSLAFILSGTAGSIAAVSAQYGHASPWIGPLELTISSFIFQVALYLITRLVRRAFTLGELCIATASGISLFLEFWRLTTTRWNYYTNVRLPPTFRAPTPIIAFQHMLVLGAFAAGFMLAPLLAMSRQMASMPSKRLRRPSERERNRVLISVGVYLGLFLIVFLLFGGWLTFILAGKSLRKPWSWALRYTFYGGDGVYGMHGEFSGWRRWRRFGLTSYWLGTIILAVGGWQTRLVRARRLRPSAGSTTKTAVESMREDKRAHVRLDLRRKFFHALAVVMFLPGIVLDPAFTSLAFALAFSFFTFAEYARYFALYPFGRSIHVFFNEFIDSKDAGPVILSHFYLLTGCAGGLWLEGEGIRRFAGVLAIGIGDACASLLGRRLGGPKWPGTSKTFAGSLAFVVSITAAAFLLVATGLCEPFAKDRFIVATVASALLEAVSKQHDNLTVPIFFGALLALLEA